MKSLSTHEKIKSQITAFLFNSRADALRDEMYQAICLYVLSEVEYVVSIDELTGLVAYAIDQNAVLSDSLKVVVADTLQYLENKGSIEKTDGRISINTKIKQALPNIIEENELNKKIWNEIQNISKSINPNVSIKEVDKLTEFYMSVCHLVAEEMKALVVRWEELGENYMDYESISALAQQARSDSGLDNILDGDKFIQMCFLDPTETLSNYEYLSIQVNTILQLLTWDPSLEYLKDQVLKGKTLYLDSSILFPLMLDTSDSHELIYNLLTASINELNVIIKVHERTLDEYDAVISQTTNEFNNQHIHLRDIVKIAKKDNIEYSEILDNQIFSDYLEKHDSHIDLGSWQRYINRIDRSAVENLLKKNSIEIDKQSAWVPNKDFIEIKENLIKASVDQLRRGKRSTAKYDTTHDAQLFSLVMKNRHKMVNERAFGYDTYLLTFDGSLTYFAKYQGISWLDTYFIFPNQWYEIAFPYLRMKINQNPNLSRSLASMVYSPLFPTLESLIPLELYGYVFDYGGTELSYGSINSMISKLREERFFERLDPSNKNLRQREQAELRLQRMISETLIEEKDLVRKIKSEVKKLEGQSKELDGEIIDKEKQLEELTSKVNIKEAEVGHYERKIEEKQHLEDIYLSSEDLRKSIQDEYSKKIEEIEKEKSEEIKRIYEESKDAVDEQQRIVGETEDQKNDALDTLSGIKSTLDNKAVRDSKIFCYGYALLFLAVWISLIFAILRLGWEIAEPWVYIIGVSITLIGYLYFAIYQEEFSLKKLFDRKRHYEKRKQKYYEKYSFDLKKYNKLLDDNDEQSANSL